MAPFLAAVALLALLGWRFRRGRSGAGPEPVDRWLVAAVLALPLLYAASVLWAAGERLDGLHLDYVGKRLAWGSGIPLTAGGGSGTEPVEDLHHPDLAPEALRLEPVPEDAAEAAGAPAGSPRLRFGPGAPVVRVDGRIVNRTPLEEGDRLVLGSRPGEAGDRTLELVLSGGALVREDGGEHPLPGLLERVLRPGRVVYLPDVLAGLVPEWPVAEREAFRSLLLHDGGWNLVLRDEGLRVLRGDRELARLDEPRPVPRSFELALQVAWGDAGRRRLRTLRRDRLLVHDDAVEVRFEEPERRRVPLSVAREAGEIGLVVPSTVDRRPELVELAERSGRFHGLSATLRYDRNSGRADLEYLGGRWRAEPEELYGLGEGDDLLLLRVGYGRSGVRVLLDLLLLALFAGVFLGRILAGSPGLTAVVGAAGLLLADRLLFSFRAATEPPGYLVRSYGEARVALWLVPALILAGWTAAVLLRRVPTAPAAAPEGTGWRGGARAVWSRVRDGFRPLRWPLAGLAVAAAGCFATVRGPGLGGLRWLALAPLATAAALLALHGWAAGPGATRVERWRRSGWRWPLWALPALGLAVLLVRLLAREAGMPEALRVPGTDFRLLWTVLQLPVAALALGLTAALLEERRWPHPVDPPAVPRRLREWWGVAAGLFAVWVFVGLAFLATGLLVQDLGLFIVHALPAAFLLALLVAWPAERAPVPRPGPAGGSRARPGSGYVLAALLALLPLLLLPVFNRWPEGFVAAYDRVATLGEPAPEGLADPATRLRASPEQQRFRLLMLANPELLSRVGIKPAEQAAVQYATIRDYASEAGWLGDGFASSKLPPHLGVTYLNDLMPMAFVLSDFGKLGMAGLALTYLAVLLAAAWGLRGWAAGGRRWGRQGAWIVTAALLAFALPGIYMILANLNLLLFTGKNATLLALNSTSDVLEAGALLGLAAFGLALGEER